MTPFFTLSKLLYTTSSAPQEICDILEVLFKHGNTKFKISISLGRSYIILLEYTINWKNSINNNASGSYLPPKSLGYRSFDNLKNGANAYDYQAFRFIPSPTAISTTTTNWIGTIDGSGDILTDDIDSETHHQAGLPGTSDFAVPCQEKRMLLQ